jgi:hypothetical protein
VTTPFVKPLQEPAYGYLFESSVSPKADCTTKMANIERAGNCQQPPWVEAFGPPEWLEKLLGARNVFILSPLQSE